MVPESQVRTASSAHTRSRARARYCGAIGFPVRRTPGRPSGPASRASRAGSVSRCERSVRRVSRGSSASRVAAGVADQRHVGGQPVADPDRVQLDLHHLHLARLRQVLGVREVRPHHQQGVHVVDQVGAGRRAEQPDTAGDVGRIVRHHHLPGQRLDDRGAQRVGHPLQQVAGAPGADPGQDGRLLPGVEQVGGGLDVGVVRADLRGEVDRGGLRRGGRGNGRPGVGARVGDLQVVGDGQVRHPAPGVGGAHRDVDQRGQLRRVDHHLVVLGHVGEEPVQVHLLLVGGAQHAGLLHAGDGQHRRVVELRVVEPVGQVDAARSGGGQAHAQPAGGLGVRGGHEGRRLLVVDQHEPDLVPVPSQPLHDPVDAVARQPEHGVHAPLGQPADQYVGDNLAHSPAATPPGPG